ncbi:MAG: carboxy terminal-processing peptidase, partial [Saprospiraceae bacterium]|nr:carboxy terminal-processing peptidase [Saprospiraceae bacterium]
DIAVELEKLGQANVQGIILDLRGNGGGSLRDVVKMGGFFVEEGPIVQVKSRSRTPEVLTDDDPSVQYSGALIVMVDQFSASASEILAAALQDYGRAVIVGTGTSTFGKGTVQRFFDLDQVVRGNPEVKPLGEVKLTVQKFFRVNGGSTQLKGVVPDIILPDNWLYVETGEKEEDFPMVWDQIDPVPFGQKVYSLANLPRIKELANARIKSNELFQKIDQRARRIKALRDDTEHTLNSLQNLPADLPSINADESKKGRNDEWLKDVKKDVYLLETLNIMHDMLVIK